MRSGAYAKNMKKEYIITAKTVEEAMSDAYSKYSADGEVSCEILEMPKKGFLGLGAAFDMPIFTPRRYARTRKKTACARTTARMMPTSALS